MFEKLYNVCRTPGRATVIGSKLHSPVPFRLLPFSSLRSALSLSPPLSRPLTVHHRARHSLSLSRPLTCHQRTTARFSYPLETFRFVNKPALCPAIVSPFYIDRRSSIETLFSPHLHLSLSPFLAASLSRDSPLNCIPDSLLLCNSPTSKAADVGIAARVKSRNYSGLVTGGQ